MWRQSCIITHYDKQQGVWLLPDRPSVERGGVCCWRGASEDPVYAPGKPPCRRHSTTLEVWSSSLSGCAVSPAHKVVKEKHLVNRRIKVCVLCCEYSAAKLNTYWSLTVNQIIACFVSLDAETQGHNIVNKLNQPSTIVTYTKNNIWYIPTPNTDIIPELSVSGYRCRLRQQCSLLLLHGNMAEFCWPTVALTNTSSLTGRQETEREQHPTRRLCIIHQGCISFHTAG